MTPVGGRRRGWVPALLLAALAAGVFAPVARNGFVIVDDGHFVADNPQVRRGLGAATALWALTATEHANWYPVTRLSHLADVSLFGMRPGAHHLASLGWHAAAAVLLFAALAAMTGAAWRSFAVAAIFALHPLQVESVAWASERSMVLSGFFLALTLLLWVRYARRPGPGRYAAALASFALGLAAKPALVTLPFALLLLDFWPLGRLRGPGKGGPVLAPALAGRRLLEKAPLLALAAAASSVTLFTQGAGGAVQSFQALPAGVRLLNAVVSYVRYLGKAAWPADLAVFYPQGASGPAAGRAAAAGLLLAGLTALAVGAARRRPWLATGWLWYAGTLVPMAGIVQVGSQAMADRYMYLPLVGLALALVWSAAGELPVRRGRRPALGALLGAGLAACAALTPLQARLWRDSRTLLEHAVAAVPGNWFAAVNLAAALDRDGRREEAVGQFRAAVRMYPYDPATLADHLYSLGRVLAELRRHEEAAAVFADVARYRPGHGDALAGLGSALSRLGRHGEAVTAFRAAARAKPGEAGILYNLGNALAELGRNEEAAAAYREAVRANPGHARAHNNLGSALFALGRYGEAAAACAEAMRLDPGDPVAQANRERALRALGR